jgi:hypothetical protein
MSCSRPSTVAGLPLAAARIGISGNEETRIKALNNIINWDCKWTTDTASTNIIPTIVQIATDSSAGLKEKFYALDGLEKAETVRKCADSVVSLPIAAARIGASGNEQTKKIALDLINKWDRSWKSDKAHANISIARRMLKG